MNVELKAQIIEKMREAPFEQVRRFFVYEGCHFHFLKVPNIIFDAWTGALMVMHCSWEVAIETLKNNPDTDDYLTDAQFEA